MAMLDPRAEARRYLLAEQAVRTRVMLDELKELEELLGRNVGAKLAAEYHRLKTSVSPIALGAHWRAQRDATRITRERAAA